ncbi:MAG TPA: c-type cytochrome [Candidatus Angelobacter sp.]|nr:c-type cytochrome [Candidatus Angelobacter sp.]
MKTGKSRVYLVVCLQMAIVLVGLFAATRTAADDKALQKTKPPAGRLINSLKGIDIYHAYCASCHGNDGTGNGPVAPALNAKIPDLTTIAQRNGGVFPVARVKKIIVGDEAVLAHGSRDMPIWGPIFHRVEEDRDYGDVRLQNITDYLQSLQRK